MADLDYILPGRAIRLDESQRKALSAVLMELMGAREPAHAEYTKKCDIWWDLYRGVPKYATRNDPFPNASNVVLNLTRLHSDALSSRLFNTLFATKSIWTPNQQNEALGRGPTAATQWLNYEANDNGFETARPMLGWFREGIPIGRSVLQANWGTKVRHYIDPDSLRGKGKPRVVPVTTHDGPIYSWVPRRAIMWQEGCSLADSEYVIKQCTMTFSQIVAQTRSPGTWNKEEVAAIRGHSSLLPQHRSYRMGNHSYRTLGPERFRQYDIREVWIHLPMLQSMGLDIFNVALDKLYSPCIVVHIHRDTGRILNVLAKPYIIPGWPFYDFSFRGEGSDFDEGGVAMLLEHMQAAGSSLINQSIDTVTFANSIMLLTNQKELLDKRIAPNRPMFVTDPSDAAVRVLQLPKLIQPDLQLLQAILAFAERLVPAFDREGRSGGHPSPATSTVTLLEESKETLRTTLKIVRSEVSRLGEDTYTLYRQFLSPDALITRVRDTMGDADAQEVATLNATIGPRPLGFDIRALTEEQNPEAARNRAVLVDQATANYFSRIMQLVQVMTTQPAAAPNTPLGTVILKFIRASTESYGQILDSADVDQVEKYLLELESNANQPGQPNATALSALGDAAGGRLAEVAGGAVGPAIAAGIDGAATEQAEGPVPSNG